jgi:hypothetical protein
MRKKIEIRNQMGEKQQGSVVGEKKQGSVLPLEKKRKEKEQGGHQEGRGRKKKKIGKEDNEKI